MKLLLLSLITSVTFASECIEINSTELCSGDAVYALSGNKITKGQFIAKRDFGYVIRQKEGHRSRYLTFSDIAVTSGCFSYGAGYHACVGDKAEVVATREMTTVIAISARGAIITPNGLVSVYDLAL